MSHFPPTAAGTLSQEISPARTTQSRHAFERSGPAPLKFHLIVREVQPHLASLLEAALRSDRSIEWSRFDYAPSTRSMTIAGRVACTSQRAIDVYLPMLTYCAWDIVSGDLQELPAGWAPQVTLLLNPNQADEQSHRFSFRHFVQYRRRRQEFEAYGGNVLERWGLSTK